jgi:hypothetical protein
MITLKDTGNRTRQKRPLTAQECLFGRIITVLEKDDVKFPVYWSHYASWLAIANFNLQRLGKAASSTRVGSFLESDYSPADFQWASLSLELLQNVKAQWPRIYHSLGAFVNFD